MNILDVSSIAISVFNDAFISFNPVNGLRLPLIRIRSDDEDYKLKRIAAAVAVMNWELDFLSEFGITDQIIEWAGLELTSLSTDIELPPMWNDRPTWGSLRRHAMDGGGLTWRMLRRVAKSIARHWHDEQFVMDDQKSIWIKMAYKRELEAILKMDIRYMASIWPCIRVPGTISEAIDWYNSQDGETQSKAITAVEEWSCDAWEADDIVAVINGAKEAPEDSLPLVIHALRRAGLNPVLNK